VDKKYSKPWFYRAIICSYFYWKEVWTKNIQNPDIFCFLCRSIISDLKKFGKHPVTRAQLNKEDLIPLTFHYNSDSELNLGYENTNAAHTNEDHTNQSYRSIGSSYRSTGSEQPQSWGRPGDLPAGDSDSLDTWGQL